MAARRNSRAQARSGLVPFPLVRARKLLLRLPLPSAASVAAGLCLLALALGGYAAARETAAFAIREIRVEGAPPALAREVHATLAPFVGTSLLSLDGRDLLERLEGIPHVRAASFDRAFPHALVVSVDRELPVAVLRRGRESWLVSERGRVLQPVARGAHPRLPRIWVPTRVAVAPGAVVPEQHAVRGAAAAALLPESALAAVRALKVGEKELTLLLPSGLELRLGDASELRLKLAVAARIVPRLASPAAGGPQYLDVSLPERAVAGRNPQVEE